MSANVEVICKMTKISRQRSVRFDDALQELLEEMAKAEDRTFSAQVAWLVRQGLKASVAQHQRPAAVSEARSAA